MKTTNNYNFNITAYCEIDKYASKVYSIIHNISENVNLGDVTTVNVNNLPYINVLAGGSPCQDFSIAGQGKGAVWKCCDCGEEYNPLSVHFSERKYCIHCHSENIEKTRSSLLIHYLEILHHTMPDFAIYENVKNLLSKRFKPLFDMFVAELEEYGYNVYYKTLNAKYYGIPQNRERVILVAIRKDLDNGKFNFPEPVENGKTFNELLDDCSHLFANSDKDIIIDDKIMPSVKRNIMRDKELIINSDKNIFRMAAKSGFQDNVVGCKVAPTLAASNHSTIVLQKIQTEHGEKSYIKMLTAKEALKFMGFDDDDYEKASNVVSKFQIYKMAGNSIVVDMLYAVLKELFNAMPYMFENIEFCHLFSGIGAFEKAFYRVIAESNATPANGDGLNE